MCKYSPKSKQNEQISPKLSEKLPFDFRPKYTILSQVSYFWSSEKMQIEKSVLINFSSLNCKDHQQQFIILTHCECFITM